MHIGRISVAPSCRHCCSGKSIYITYTECVFVVLGIHLVIPLHHILLSFVACLALQDFSMLFHKSHDFRKEMYIRNKRCVLISSKMFI
jgi:hypothetical protein